MKENLLILFMLLFSITITAQTVNVSGNVTDANNEPLPGVTVLEKGTTNGTSTDVDGNYRLSVSGKSSELKLKPDGDPMARSDWIKFDAPILTRNDEGGVFGPGHNGFFKSPDGTEDWVIYHARDLPGGGSTNYRNTRIQKVLWDDEGIPFFEKAVAIGKEIKRPSGE